MFGLANHSFYHISAQNGKKTVINAEWQTTLGLHLVFAGRIPHGSDVSVYLQTKSIASGTNVFRVVDVFPILACSNNKIPNYTET